MKIKKTMYSIIKELQEGESIPTANDYELSDEEFQQILKLMINEQLLNSKRVSFYVTGDYHIEKSLDTVTMKGIEFLEQNNKWVKLYKGLKEIKDFISI